jgi:FeS assembly protein IscX
VTKAFDHTSFVSRIVTRVNRTAMAVVMKWLPGDFMPREIDWTDVLEIGIQLQEMFPDTDPYSVRFTDMHKWVTQLPGFVGDPAKSSEGVLEAIQTAWHEEYIDAKDA